MTAPLLSVEAVSLSFGGLKAVSDLSLSLAERQLWGLIGPNGAGKTTAFNLLTGVYRPDAGSVRLAGRRLDGLPPHRITGAGLARTFQNIRLFPDLSVLDNVRVACHLGVGHGLLGALLRTPRHRRDEEEMEERSRALLALFGLEGRAGEEARSLPYGDQRRLEIARALATGPKVLLLDEPAAGMNPQEKDDLVGLVRSLPSRFGVAVLLIEHDMGVVMDLVEGITVLDHGETIAVGAPEAIRRDPTVVEAYLGTGAERTA